MMKNKFITEQNKIFLPDEKWNTIAEIDFQKINNTTYDIYHTFVDESMRWQWIADELVNEAKKYLTRQWYSIVATCPFAKKKIKDQ